MTPCSDIGDLTSAGPMTPTPMNCDIQKHFSYIVSAHSLSQNSQFLSGEIYLQFISLSFVDILSAN